MDMNNMRERKPTKACHNIWTKLGCLLGLTFVSTTLFGQDLLPACAKAHPQQVSCKEYAARIEFPVRPVTMSNSMPETFKDTLTNSLLRSDQLYPFFERLLRHDAPVRVVHLGDSHVRGHVFPIAVRHRLEQAWGSYAVKPDSITYRTSALASETGQPGLVYHALGINGATTHHFMNPEKLNEVEALHPDVVILSFGTNESHGRRYDETIHTNQLDSLLHAVRIRCPQAIVVLTTPPGSYIRQRRRGRVVNQLTPRVVKNILNFAQKNSLPVWDLYDIVGGSRRACQNWTKSRLMQRDRVHYTHEGYRVQGRLLAEAILKAYNDYVSDRLD